MNKKELIQKLKTCEYCNKEFEVPVLLPCGETLCKKHVRDMLKEDHHNMIICFFCSLEHHYSDKKNHFPENKIVTKLIELNAQNERIETCVSESIDSYEELKTKIQELEQASANPSGFLHGYFTSLKNRIDIKKTECDLIAEKIHTKMVNDLHLFETECQTALDVESHGKKTKLDLNQLKEKLNELKRNIHYLQNTEDKKEIEIVNSELLKLKTSIDFELAELKDKLFLGMEFSFESKQLSLQSNLFGLFKMVLF